MRMVGTFWRKGKPNPAEKSWLRLSAGCAMLNICEQKGVGDKFNTEQFYTLSKLVTDPVPQVREQFLIYYMKTDALWRIRKGYCRAAPQHAGLYAGVRRTSLDP